MKKFLFFASAATLLLGSCADDLMAPNNGGSSNGKDKIKVTFPLTDGTDDATRTSLGYNNQGYYYQWDNGDAIGVFNANYNASTGYGADRTNEQFVYESGTTEAIFGGNADALVSSAVIGYYPYNQTAQILTGGNLTLYINQYQNFNSTVAEAVDWNDEYASGCFSQGSAPAIAFGSNDGEGISLTFNGVASYLVLPVANYTDQDITRVVLTILGKDGKPILLAGSLDVNLLDYKSEPAATMQDLPVEAPSNPLLGDGESIEMNMGKYSLTNEIVNLWFVLPASTQISGNTINLDFYNGETLVGSANRPFSSVNYGGKMGYNKVRWIWQGEQSPFACFDGDSYYINTPYKFLEYANLVSTPVGERAQLLAEYAKLDNTNFTDLANMCTLTPTGSESYTLSAIKPAVVAQMLEFSQEDVKTWISKSLINGQTELAPYYQTVYGNYIDSEYGTIPSIGSDRGVSLQISGLEGAGLDGLNIEGNSVFFNKTATTYAGNEISGLTLTNMKVYPQEALGQYYFFLADTYSANITGNPDSPIVVGEGCEVVIPDSETEEEPYVAVLNNIWPKTFVGGTVVNESEIPYYANTLVANAPFDFTAENNPTVYQINTINVIKETYPVLTIQDQTEAERAMSLVPETNTYVYHVIDNGDEENEVAPTSYWTGLVSWVGSNAYAENFAKTAQYGGDFTFKGYNLNLMGKNTEGEVYRHWWNGGLDNVTITNNDEFTVSNVYIDGTKDGETSGGNYLNLLGQKSVVTNLLVDNITIVNEENEEALISAISTYQGGVSTSIVTNYNVNAEVAYEDVIGGLYWQLGVGGLNNIKGSALVVGEDPVLGEDVVFGSISGNLDINVSTSTLTITNPSYEMDVVASEPYFGNVKVTVTPVANQSTTITLVGLPQDFITDENLIPSSTFATANYNGYAVMVTNGDTKYTYYYNSKLNDNKGGFSQYSEGM